MNSFYQSLLAQQQPQENEMQKQLLTQYNNAIAQREQSIDEARQRAAALEEQGQDFRDVNLKPLMSAVDAWTGSNMAQGYQNQANPNSRAMQIEKLRQAVGQQEAGLIDDRLNVARLVTEDARAKEGRLFKAAQLDSDADLRRELLNTRIGANRDAAEARRDGKIVADAGKPVKESGDAWKAAGFAKRIEQTDEVFNGLINEGYNGPSRSEWAAGFVLPNEAMSPKYQRYDQAARNFINATLRRESGAAISAGEFSNAKRQYLPQPGDDPATLAQKAANRAQVRENMKAESGTAYARTPYVSPTGELTAGTQAPMSGTVKVTNGQEIMEIPVEDLPSAMRDGFKQVR